MDEKNKAVLKRVFAWIYLALFVLVILNLMIFDFYKDIFLFAYIALIAVYFVVFKNPPASTPNTDKEQEDNKNKNIESKNEDKK